MDTIKIMTITSMFMAMINDTYGIPSLHLRNKNSKETMDIDCNTLCQSIPEFELGSYEPSCGGCICNSTFTHSVRDRYDPCIPLSNDIFTRTRACSVLCRRREDFPKKRRAGAYKSFTNNGKRIERCFCYEAIDFGNTITSIKFQYLKITSNVEVEGDCIDHCAIATNRNASRGNLLAYNYDIIRETCYCLKETNGIQISYNENEIKLIGDYRYTMPFGDFAMKDLISEDLQIYYKNFCELKSGITGRYSPHCLGCRCQDQERFDKCIKLKDKNLAPYRCHSIMEIEKTESDKCTEKCQIEYERPKYKVGLVGALYAGHCVCFEWNDNKVSVKIDQPADTPRARERQCVEECSDYSDTIPFYHELFLCDCFYKPDKENFPLLKNQSHITA